MKTEKLAPWVAAWPEERTTARLERCRSMLAACGLIGDKTSQRLTRRIKDLDGKKNRRVGR